MIQITSVQNPKIKQVVKWRDRRHRDRDQKVLVEGYRALTRAIAGNYPIDELYICPELFQGENEGALIAALEQRGATLYEVAAPAFHKMAYRDRPEGLLGIGPQRHRGLAELEAIIATQGPEFYLVCEQIEKPGNLGTMLRSADAAGVSAIILCDSRTDLFNPNVVRASTGNLFTMPIAETTSAEAAAWLKKRGVQLIASSPHVATIYTAVDMTGPVAIIVGAEEFGLSDFWLQTADVCARLPMMGEADSLNVATATTIMLYEVLRQRIACGAVKDSGAVPNGADC
ncbi:MAG: RNA methyltransferase [Lentisphaerae bacterium]|jgi:TrmH family RNA methyltransferase|nr:RNA methyltransferase [Lentisphaerota bacterium]